MTVKTDLEAAAQYIQDNGWCRNEFVTAQGRVCLAGALGVVTGAIKPATEKQRRAKLKNEYNLADEDVEEAIAGKGGWGDLAVWTWSDALPRRNRYHRALTQLSATLDSEATTSRLAAFDADTQHAHSSDWYKQMTDADRAYYDERRLMSRSFVSQDVVTTWNDRVTEGKVARGKTTKAQAVKLLQRAAAAAG